MPTKGDAVLVDRQGPIAVLQFNRPELRNALDGPMLALTLQRLQQLDCDADVRVIVLTGAGDKAFVAGADITEMATRTMYTELGDRARLMRETCNTLETMSKPTIAAVNGYAFGGGCEVALACDMRLASATATLGLLEVNLGIMPGGGGTQRLLRLCGRAVAAELIMTGRVIDAEEALRVGLVNRVTPPDRLMEASLELARTIAAKSPFTLRGVKDALRAGANMGQTEGILYENKLFALCMETEDKREGVAAFLERRTAQFGGN
jgi:enoyl-CoA hydratase